MTRLPLATLLAIGIGGAALVHVASAAENAKDKEAKEAPKEPAAAVTPAPAVVDSRMDGVVDEAALTTQDKEIRGWATAFAADCGKVLEGWIDSQAVTEEKLFARLYYPIPNTNPAKYTTDYDTLSDRDIGPLQERYLAKSLALSYVVLGDLNGYVPTHNQKYSQPLTGNLAVDLVNNRTKRIFMTTVGFRSARSQAPFLLQVNERDNGERALNLSVPVRVHGKHWGAVRFGYRPAEK
ncbi:MAG: hypothetical protein QM756_33545 [Polyangiaceae bacterium]